MKVVVGNIDMSHVPKLTIFEYCAINIIHTDELSKCQVSSAEKVNPEM